MIYKKSPWRCPQRPCIVTSVIREGNVVSFTICGRSSLAPGLYSAMRRVVDHSESIAHCVPFARHRIRRYHVLVRHTVPGPYFGRFTLVSFRDSWILSILSVCVSRLATCCLLCHDTLHTNVGFLFAGMQTGSQRAPILPFFQSRGNVRRGRSVLHVNMCHRTGTRCLGVRNETVQ